MTGAPTRLNNALPDVAIAVHTHRIVAAKQTERAAKSARRLAERVATQAGVPVGAVHRVGRNMVGDPAMMQRQMEEDAVIAKGTRAGFQVEQPTLFDATTDVSDAEWERRLQDEGYGAAVWCLPASTCPYTDPENAALWNAGYAQFQADLEAYQNTEQQDRSDR